MTIRGGGIDGESEIDQALLKAPKDPTSDARMLDCEFTVVEGQTTANVVVENTKITPAGDMTRVFGKDSAEWIEARDHAALAQTDFVGIAIHCAQGGGICNTSSHAKADVLPDEPGGYNGFSGLFGAKYVNPAITGGAVRTVTRRRLTCLRLARWWNCLRNRNLRR